jgi:hypothetical protein
MPPNVIGQGLAGKVRHRTIMKAFTETSKTPSKICLTGFICSLDRIIGGMGKKSLELLVFEIDQHRDVWESNTSSHFFMRLFRVL